MLSLMNTNEEKVITKLYNHYLTLSNHNIYSFDHDIFNEWCLELKVITTIPYSDPTLLVLYQSQRFSHCESQLCLFQIKNIIALDPVKVIFCNAIN